MKIKNISIYKNLNVLKSQFIRLIQNLNEQFLLRMALNHGTNSLKKYLSRHYTSTIATAKSHSLVPFLEDAPLKKIIRPKMRFIQFLRKNDFRHRLGVVSEDGLSLTELSGGSCISHNMIEFINQNIPADEIKRKIDTLPTEEITDMHTLLPPVITPEKIVCIGLNYKDHCEEQNKPPPKEPMFFSKFTTALVGPRSNVVAHRISNKIDWECELAVIIGKTAKNVQRPRAMDHIFGFSIAQDITARDWQRRNGGQFLLGKSMDTFLPLGPALVHKSLVPNVYDLEMTTRVNGVVKQKGNTGNMIYKIEDIICILTQFITLNPGDIILTGTPAGVGCYRNPPEYLKPGDVVETEIQCLGKLKNLIVDD